LLYIDRAVFISASILDEETAVLRFRTNCQEINCLICKKEGKIVEGNETYIESCQYQIDIMKNPEPIVEEVGHDWIIVGLQRMGVVKQLL